MSVIHRIRRSLYGKIAAGATAAGLIGALCGGFASAATQTVSGTGTATGTVPISGAINPTTISVTVPINAAYTIDPTANTFTSAPLQVTNNTVVPVNVGIQSLTADTSNTFTDKLPGDENWAGLNAADSAKYLALGVGIADGTGWNTGYSSATDWAAAHTAVSSVGTLNPTKSGNVALTAQFGRAFSAGATPVGSLVFSFSLA